MYIPRYAISDKNEIFLKNAYGTVRHTPMCVVKTEKVFLDIGAKIGLCFAAALGPPGVKVIAIEPRYWFKKILESNLSNITTKARFKI